MSGEQRLKKRRLRLTEFIAESLHQIADHSSEPSAAQLHKAAYAAATSPDPTMVTILEEDDGEEPTMLEEEV